ncbi:MAG TPA: recombinase family protein, partial [Azospirillaceae bacterium]|nr:recombinase family protein [Azospirillaceae bacterium]
MSTEAATGLLIGYARVSTDDQKLDLQRDAMAKAGVDPARLYTDQMSAVKARRPGLEAALKALRP